MTAVTRAAVVRRASHADLAEIEAILTAASLPLHGAMSAFRNGVVAVDDSIVGCAAVEPYASFGLLRSVVVVPDRRGGGIGRLLVEALEALALELGIETLYLLTESAEGWFSALGYGRVDRSDVPPEVQGSVEFEVACPSTAVAMKKPLVAGRAEA